MSLTSGLLLLSVASYLRPGLCQNVQSPSGLVNFTYEIPFELRNDDIYALEYYSFNISVGTPPQLVPASIQFASSDVRIFNETIRPNPSNPARPLQQVFYAYDPTKSSSFVKEQEVVVLRNRTIQSVTAVTSAENALNATYAYAADNYTIGSLPYSAQLSFLTQIATTFLSPLRNTITLNSSYAVHSVGLGPPENSALNSGRPTGNGTRWGGLIQSLIRTNSIIRSHTFSLWLDSPQERSGHLLLGGVDSKAYTGKLTTLNTTVHNVAFGLYNGSILTAGTSIQSLTLPGQPSTPLNIAVGDTEFTSSFLSYLPESIVTSIWDRLGVDYKTYNGGQQRVQGASDFSLELAEPIVPCSYLTNSTTLDFQFSGSNITVRVPMSDLTFQNPYRYFDGNGEGVLLCQLSIRASQGDYPATFGTPILKQLYQVYDWENKAISIALTNFTATARDIQPIPKEGGVVAMNFSSNAGGNTTVPSAGANNLNGLLGSSSITGCLCAVLGVAAAFSL